MSEEKKNKNRKKIICILAILALAGAFCFRENSAQIYAGIGNAAYNKKNFNVAESFYEKSLKKGNKNENIREKYANILISKPLNIETQEKLVNLMKAKQNDLAYWIAKSHLLKLKYGAENTYSKNYIDAAAYNGKIIRWSTSPIKYAFAESNKKVPVDYEKAVDAAFKQWENKTIDSIKFSKVDQKNADVIINFLDDKDIEYSTEGTKYVIAYTVPEVSNNKLKKMQVYFYKNDMLGKPHTRNQLYNIALHEIFHAIGFMGHYYDKQSIMFMEKGDIYNTTDEIRKLTVGDISTADLLYKIKPDITNVKVDAATYVPYVLIGDSFDINNSKLKQAKTYIHNAPHLPSGYIDLAEAYLGLGEFDKSIKFLNKALTLTDNPEFLNIINYDLAVAHFYNSDYDESLNYAQKTLSIKDDNDTHSLLAEIYNKTNNTNKAITELENLIAKDPSSIDYHIKLANIYIEKHDYLKARKILKTYITNNPQERNNSLLNSYGLLLL